MKKRTVYLILFCLILAFIVGNSMLSRETSGAISHFIADLFGGEGGASDEGHYFLRKAAHFCEFAALGAVFYLFLSETGLCRSTRTALCAFVGVLVPLIDETVQIFSDRGSALSDVWLDISGYAVGLILTFFVSRTISRRGDRRESAARD